MKHPALMVLCSLGLSLSTSRGAAQPEPISLQEAVEIALAHHPSLRAADANLRASSAGLAQSEASYFPSISASATASRTGGAFVFNPSTPIRDQFYNNYTAGLQLQQTIYDFGKTGGRVSANRRFVEASSADFEATRENVIVNAQVAYFALLQSQRVEQVNEQAVQLAEDHLRQAKAFYSVGRRPQFDVTKAEVDLANAQVNLIRARNQSHLANVQLENAIGLHPSAGFAVTDTFQITPFAIPLDSAKASAFQNRPDIRSAEARAAANDALVTATFGQHLPTLSATGSYTWSGFDFPLYNRWNAGVALSFPIFQGFGINAQVDQAKANADAARANLESLREAVTLDVQQNYLGLEEAEERIGATAKLVAQAEENLRLAEKQYAAGIGTPIDVADASVAVSNARITRIQALYDYNSSLVRLRRAMGTL